MALYPQGTFQYTGGIDDSVPILGGWEVSLVHGLTPSSFNISIPMVPGVGPPQKNGDVILRYGDAVITLKDCTIDRMQQDEGGALVWNLSILDRRWRWRFRAVSGRWNVRWKNGTDVREETQATPSALAAICLDALGETDYDVDALKTFDGTDWPEIDWTVENAAEALQTLCERYECRAVYDWQEDRVVVVVVGKGAALDLTIPYTQASGTFDPPEKPGKLVLLCGPSSVQYDLALEPVGLDVDGKIKYLDQLSYAPEKPSTDALQPELGNDAFQYDRWLPWEGSDRGFYNIGVPYLRQYALDTVLKWYRVVPPKAMDGLQVIAGDRTDIEGLDDFGSIAEDADRSWLWRIELQGEQNDRLTTLADPLATQFDEYNKEVSQTPLQAWVYGNFQSALLRTNVLRDDFGLDENQDSVVIPFSGLKKLNPALIFSPAQQQASTLPNQDVPAQLQAKVEETGFYTGGFSIDAERGIVKFSEQVVQVAPPKNPQIIWRNSKGDPLPDDLSNVIFPASLWLRTRFFVRDQNRALVRYQKTRVLDPESDTVRYIIRDDLTLKLTYRFDTNTKPIDVSKYPPTLEASGAETNQDVIDKACDAYLDQIEDEYETRQPQTVVYPGFLPLTLDGAIRQVTWFVDFQGFAYTRVSRDQEELHMVRDYADRRLAERLKAMADRDRANRDPKAQLAAEAERKWAQTTGKVI